MTIPDQSKRHTYEDWQTWEGSWELINGRAYNMTPAPSTMYQFAVGELFYAMRSYFQNHGCLVLTAPFNVYFSVSNHFEKPDDIMQPDITVVCNKNQIVSKGCFGAPTLIVEVLSPATALKDYNEKFDAYQRYGVKEYWIVDTANRMIHVYHLKDGAYLERVTYGEEDTLFSIEYSDLHIPLQSIFALET